MYLFEGEGPVSRVKVIPVIMSGGSGSRLWPISTDERPKQFRALEEDRTMIQATALRFRKDPAIEFLDPIVVCNARHIELLREQFSAVGITPSAVVLEPVARNTAAVAATAALVALDIDPEALVLLAPADHVMKRPELLRAAIVSAALTARSRIVIFGIRPTGPATGFGYIRRAEILADGVFRVDHFLEKPPLEDAARYFADGGYDWNAGLFLFAPAILAEEMLRHAPGVWNGVEAALRRAKQDGSVIHLDAEAFGEVPSISIDHAVMERTGRAAVAPCDPGWSDIGSWSELWRHLKRDDAGNALKNGIAIDCENNLVYASGGPPVAVVGLSNVIVVSTPDGVLVVNQDRDQDVRRVHALLSEAEDQWSVSGTQKRP